MAEAPSNAPATPNPTPTEPTNEPAKSALDSILDPVAAADPPAEPAPAKDGEPPKEPKEPAKAGAPEKYADFTLPEGLVLEEATLKEATDMFRAQGLDQATAQKFVDMHANALKAAAEGPYKLFKDTQDAWVDELNSDPVLGPRVKSGEVGASINKMMNSLPVEQNKALREAMNFTGAGNHPAVVRAFFELSKRFAEPSSSPSGNPAGGGKAKPTGAQAMYPDHPSKG